MNPSLPELPFRDIHLPDPAGWWPLAPGWWILFTFLLGCSILAFLWLQKYLQTSLKKDASKELNTIEKIYEQTQNATRCISDLSILLRRIVLSQKQKTPVAGITGVAWLKLLDQRLGTVDFSQGPGRILLAGPYQPAVEKQNVEELIRLCRKWVSRL
jgi:hypothetical protein